MNPFTVGIASEYLRDISRLFLIVVMLVLVVAACEASQPSIPAQYTGGQGGIAALPGDAAQTVVPTGGNGASGEPTAGSASGGTQGSMDASSSPSTLDGSTAEVGTVFDASEGNDGAAGASGGSGGSASVDSGTPPPLSGDAEEVCARWKADTANMSEGTWSGNVASCDPGDISAEGRENALRMLNLFRWLADLPAIQTDPTLNQKAQACALIMRANNNNLSHDPPQSWACWTQEGADAAGNCNISSGPGVGSVKGYMIDMGNPTTIGHRRWILSNTIGPTGLGSTDGASCMWTMGTSQVGKAWVAWPPAGVMPIQAMSDFWANTDSTGWTIQSDTINLSGAQVTVTSDGETLPVTVTQLSPWYGSFFAIRFNPQGWQSQAGKIYSVSVSGTTPLIEYQVEMANCI